MQFYQWAIKWGVPPQAMQELVDQITAAVTVNSQQVDARSGTEGNNSKLMELDAMRHGCKLYRNNVGAWQDPETGRVTRYGLGNESKQQNEVSKSSDLIGIRKIVIEPRHVGSVIGQFVAREMKQSNWQYTGDAHELAQANFINFINSMGGDARFDNTGRFEL
jgi:hypothetical protein